MEEALYYTEKCKASIIIVGPELMERATEIQSRIKQEHGRDVGIINTETMQDPAPLSSKPHIDPSITFHPRRPGLLLFTSGSSGNPKGVVHSLEYFNMWCQPTKPDSLFLCHRSMHWGLGMSGSISSIMVGMPLLVLGSSSHPAGTWDAIRDRKPTITVGTPYFWYTMMEHYDSKISKLPAEQKDKYLEGLKHMRAPICCGATATPYAKRFWNGLLGFPLPQGYGATEISGVSSTSLETSSLDKVNTI